MSRNVIREGTAMKKREIDIVTVTIGENVTEIEEVTVTEIVNASARGRRRVTASQRVTEGVTLGPQRKNERIRTRLIEVRAKQMRSRNLPVNNKNKLLETNHNITVNSRAILGFSS